MKVWDEGTRLNSEIEAFTTGKDRELDLLLAAYDVIGTIAHVMMLEHTRLITPEESSSLISVLRDIHRDINKGVFCIGEGIEDVHSQLELILTEKLGDTGKKVHTGRSRNDQVLLDIQLFIRKELSDVSGLINELFSLLQRRSEETREIFLPGYTHLQVAMPSSFGLWFGAYAEALADDMITISAAWKTVNQNPLGSAAGYGTSLPIDRKYTTKILAFEDMRYNVVNAQMSRGKIEGCTAQALANLCTTLGRFATDLCLYNSQNFDFIRLPGEFTTGSSIMPHKRNPDVFELIRARCNSIKALPNNIYLVAGNLPSGYHRDYQLLKEMLLPAFDQVRTILRLLILSAGKIEVNRDLAGDERYDYTSSVDQVNKLVQEGIPFREAYRKVAEKIRKNEFPAGGLLPRTHEGSAGNLCNREIKRKMDRLQASVSHGLIDAAYSKLLGRDQ